MKRNKRLGFVYQPKYRDRAGELKTSPTWWISYSHRGRKIRLSSNSTRRADAVKLLKAKLGEIGSGRPPIVGVERTTFEDLAKMLTDDYAANGRRSADKLGFRIAHLRSFFGMDRAIDITANCIAAYTAHRREEGAANGTINRELAALRRMFRLAYRAGKAGTPPIIDLLQEPAGRKGFFERDQFKSVMRHLPDYLQPVIHTAYITGWRVASEILTRKKHHLDPDAGWLRLDAGETKNGQGRMFPSTPELREVLLDQLNRTRTFERASGQIVPWLFHRGGGQIKNFRAAWATACKRAGLPDRIPHDFRRTAVRNLERAGISRSAAMAMVGHKTQAIYQRYAIADETALKEAAVKLATLHQTEQLSKNVHAD